MKILGDLDRLIVKEFYSEYTDQVQITVTIITFLTTIAIFVGIVLWLFSYGYTLNGLIVLLGTPLVIVIVYFYYTIRSRVRKEFIHKLKCNAK